VICFQQADKSIGRLSADCSNDLKGKAEAGFVGGFDKGLKGFLQFLMAFYMPEIKHLPHLYYIPAQIPEINLPLIPTRLAAFHIYKISPRYKV
jgi:hypothetical protein